MVRHWKLLALIFNHTAPAGQSAPGTWPVDAKGLPGVEEVHLTVGRYDGLVLIGGASFEAAAETAMKLGTLRGVKRVETLVIVPHH